MSEPKFPPMPTALTGPGGGVRLDGHVIVERKLLAELADIKHVVRKLIKFEWGADGVAALSPNVFNNDRQRHLWLRLEALVPPTPPELPTEEPK